MYKYIHGGDIYAAKKMTGREDILDFSANINPLGLPEAVKSSVLAGLEECTDYPDPFCRELVAALAEYEQIDPKNIFCANGASEIIFRLALALKPRKALLFAPTFADYEKALHTVECTVQTYPLKAEHDFCVQEDFLEQIDQDLNLIIICNPNNPTGQVCSVSFLYNVLAKCQTTNTIVLLDECFMDFIDQPENCSVQPSIELYSNLLVLKAFTKIFAMPGLRLGYVLTSNHELLEKLRNSGQDWSVSTLAQKAGVAALKQKDYLSQSKTVVMTERNYLTKELSSLGFQLFGSKANYIFFKTTDLKELDKKLLAKGILIRSCANYNNLSAEYYRVAVKKHSDNLQLITAIRDVITNESHHGDY